MTPPGGLEFPLKQRHLHNEVSFKSITGEASYLLQFNQTFFYEQEEKNKKFIGSQMSLLRRQIYNAPLVVYLSF